MSAPFSLNVIQVASPCEANWNAMTGDARVRHCDACQKHVYNLSEMTHQQAEALILAKEGKLCVTFFRRADGTILTADCPVGLWEAAHRRMSYWLATAAAGLVGLVALGVGMTRTWSPLRMYNQQVMGGLQRSFPPVAPVAPVAPFAPVAPMQCVMGEMVVEPVPDEISPAIGVRAIKGECSIPLQPKQAPNAAQ